MQLLRVRADDDDEIGAIASLGQGGGDPAARLQHPEIAELRIAQRVIDDATGAVGERHHSAHAFDIGRQAAKHRQPRLAHEFGGGTHRSFERDGLAVDLRAGCRESALETGDRLLAIRVADFQVSAGARNLKIVAHDATERARHMLVRFGRTFSALVWAPTRRSHYRASLPAVGSVESHSLSLAVTKARTKV